MTFSDVIRVEGKPSHPFSCGGDSGSLAFLANSYEGIGLVFAGGLIQRDGVSVPVSYICPLAGILNFFKSTLV